MTTWFRALGITGKLLSVIGAVFVAGVMAAAWFGLPAQVRVNKFNIQANTDSMSGVRSWLA